MARKIMIRNTEYEIEDEEYDKAFSYLNGGMASFPYWESKGVESPRTFLERAFGL